MKKISFYLTFLICLFSLFIRGNAKSQQFSLDKQSMVALQRVNSSHRDAFIAEALDERQFKTDTFSQRALQAEDLTVIKGHIFHKFTNEPLAGATVSLYQNDQLIDFCLTDENGFYSVNGDETDMIIVQHPDFYTIEQPVHFESKEKIEMHFTLICKEPSPPRNAVCASERLKIDHYRKFKYFIRWKASLDSKVVYYRIFCGDKVIGDVPASKELKWTLTEKRPTERYYIIAVNAFDQCSEPCTVTLR